MSLARIIQVTFVSTLLISACHHTGHVNEDHTLGVVHLKVSGSQEAQPHFERGLLLLHSFEYHDARQAFKDAQESDPDFAMAYWGEAMAHNYPLWRRQSYEKGVEALNRLAPTAEERLEKAVTDLEKDLISAVDVLYGEGDKFERDEAYAKHMAALYKKYPDNHEVAAFYALSLLGSVEVGRDDEVFEKGAVVAKGILDENPSHPGALHYLIHSYDDPSNAYKALEAANSYSVVAKDASHALHMPSHIYVALGMWDEVVNSNTDSWEASVQRMERMDLDNDAQSYHALHWLMYGYLQQGRFAEATDIMHNMIRYTEEKPSRVARDYIVSMKGNYLVETGDWSSEFSAISPEVEDLNVSTQGILHYTKGVKSYLQGDVESLAGVITVMEDIRQDAESRIVNTGVAMCGRSGQEYSSPNRLDVNQLHIMQMELQSLEATLADDHQKAEFYLSQAVELQEAISYSYGPPVIVKPSYEMYGDWLIEHDRFQEALEAYELALKRGPRRIAPLSGRIQALQALGEQEEADAAKEELLQILHRSDGTVIERYHVTASTSP